MLLPSLVLNQLNNQSQKQSKWATLLMIRAKRHMRGHIAYGSLILFLKHIQHRQNLTATPPSHIGWCLTKHSTKWDESLCVWWSGECQCTHWLSISALTVIRVISLQFPHSKAKWDLPGSLSKYLKHKNDGIVCLPYIFPQLANCFCWQHDETLIIQMLFFVCYGLFFFFYPFLFFWLKLKAEYWLDPG